MKNIGHLSRHCNRRQDYRNAYLRLFCAKIALARPMVVDGLFDARNLCTRFFVICGSLS